MSKLLQDPKVTTLIEKEVAKALKQERGRTAKLMKLLVDELKLSSKSLKDERKYVDDLMKALAGDLKDISLEIKNPAKKAHSRPEEA